MTYYTRSSNLQPFVPPPEVKKKRKGNRMENHDQENGAASQVEATPEALVKTVSDLVKYVKLNITKTENNTDSIQGMKRRMNPPTHEQKK